MEEAMGPKNAEWMKRYKESMLPSTVDEKFPVIVSGKGIHVKDVDGNLYVDMNSQVGIGSIGHCNPTVMRALRRYIAEPEGEYDGNLLAIIGSDYVHPLMVELAENLKRITPGDGVKKVGFASSGARAISSAVKLLQRARPERPYFFSFTGAIHGRIGPALQLTCSKYVQKDGYERLGNFYKARYIDTAFIRELVGTEMAGNRINGIVLEMVQGEGGNVPANPNEVEMLKELCAEYNIKLIVDEIQTGLGRTGKMWACEHYGLVPDILVTSKALASGSAIAAYIANDQLLGGREEEILTLGWDSETFYAPPLACTMALATIWAIEKDELVKNAALMGDLMGTRLNAIERKSDRHKARGLGLMWGLEFTLPNGLPDPKSRNEFVYKALDEGLLFMGSGRGIPAKNPTVRFMPPLPIIRNELDEVMDEVENILFHSHP
jgi:4-aminobutyrate aminotransferase